MSKTCPSHETNKTWSMVRLGDVCEIIAGQSPEGSYYTDESCYTEFHQGSKSFGTRELQISGVYTKKETKIAKPGSLLISVRAPVGDLNITTRRVCIGRGLAALIPDDSISRDFLWLFLTSATKAVNDAAGAGSCFSSLSRSQLSGLEIPLPPLSVQREIVARLERELAAVEKMKKGFEALAETAKAEFKAELKDVFEEISRGGAETRRLGEICELISDCPHTTAKDEGVGIPLIRTPNVGFTRLILAGVHRVSEDVYKQRTKRAIPLPGDLIFAREAPAGNVAVIQSGEKVCLGQRTVLLRLRKGCFSDYIAYSVLQPESQKILIQRSTGSTVAHVNVCDIKTFPIHVPPLSVQREVVARLDAAKARAEKLEAKAREGVAVCETMRKAILKEAFEGG